MPGRASATDEGAETTCAVIAGSRASVATITPAAVETPPCSTIAIQRAMSLAEALTPPAADTRARLPRRELA